MATNINIWFENWRYTGSNVSIPQAKVNMRVEWLDNEKQPQLWEDEVTWPNDFAFLSDAQRKAILEELMLRIARIRLGISE